MDGGAIPPKLDDNFLLTVQELGALIDAPESAVDDSRLQGAGPR